MLRISLDARETLPLENAGSDGMSRDGRFERRREIPGIRTMTKRHHGFTRYLAAKGYRSIGRSDDGFLGIGLQIHTTVS